MGECKLLEGWFASFIQLFLAAVALSSLWYKRLRERPQRQLIVWACDVGKQAAGAAFAHVLNILIAMYLSAVTGDGSDECAWYFINYAVDSSLGTLFAFILLVFFNAVFRLLDLPRLYKTGEYGNPPNFCTWLMQFIIWMCIILIVKMTFLIFQVQFEHHLSTVGSWLFLPLSDYPKLELTIVMVICPCIFNVVQFWIADTFLKAKNSSTEDKDLDYLEYQDDEYL
mmetsp:Transcript_9205/g.12179  ORF Transcript_9205/g.12179 Transcript_9205/m.12179 type:complete len:226 (+) Transcript_9205:117-794(+)|eukprot:CAMPEP_0117755184 /NCGR_PEP_ID=MMETSP0947-20121206/13295_1 /TAXON_ID=44440 /ORGANISM="Chattonella subsalsa, Strain CCMP2191" /LENGTH=225 /DNA_ID=CAMNT_0005574459 /DNA_START=100 /DNA_END=777 /DNA_ORIENTATION=+